MVVPGFVNPPGGDEKDTRAIADYNERLNAHPELTTATVLLSLTWTIVGVLLSIIPLPLCCPMVHWGSLVQLRVCENVLPRAFDERSVAS